MAFLVHEAEATPGTHVLLIGAGSYPCLIGGDPGRLLENPEGMQQLSSPPVSARHLARWFIERFNNPARPLASVALLLSESTPAPFVHPRTQEEIPVAVASIDNIGAAITEWLHRSDSHVENLPIFYFCGHGLAQGAHLALLSESYGDDPENPLAGAIDFLRLHNGMRRCRAQHQVYLIDACRTYAASMQSNEGYAGRVFLQPTGKAAYTKNPVFYSTLKGLPAYGRGASPSSFTEALLAGLDGAASDDADGDWRVSTDLLQRALSAHMKRKIDAGMASVQINVVENLTSFDLHWLPETPRVPVFVTCAPMVAARHGTLHYAVSGTAPPQVAPPPNREAWELVLEYGRYDFEATFTPPSPYSTGRVLDYPIRPPYRVVGPLKVI